MQIKSIIHIINTEVIAFVRKTILRQAVPTLHKACALTVWF